MDNTNAKYYNNYFEDIYIFNEKKFYIDYAKFLLNKLNNKFKKDVINENK